MSTDETYQGWANHETWHVALVLNNDQETQRSAHAYAEHWIEQAPEDENVRDSIWTVQQAERYRLADSIKDWIDSELPSLDDVPEPARYHAQAFMQSGFERVDWTEIADSLLRDVRESVTA